jgi:hypothetical protein
MVRSHVRFLAIFSRLSTKGESHKREGRRFSPFSRAVLAAKRAASGPAERKNRAASRYAVRFLMYADACATNLAAHVRVQRQRPVSFPPLTALVLARAINPGAPSCQLMRRHSTALSTNGFDSPGDFQSGHSGNCQLA